MAPFGVQFACGVFALAIPLLLAAGYYAQLLLDRLGERRDLLVTILVTAGACLGEAAALFGVVQPHRVCRTIGAIGAAISATWLLSVPFYAAQLRKKQRISRGHRGHHEAEGRRTRHLHAEKRSAPPNKGGADQRR